MTDVADPKTPMDQAAPTALAYLSAIERQLLEDDRYSSLREEQPTVYYQLVGNLMRAASADYASSIIARAIELNRSGG